MDAIERIIVKRHFILKKQSAIVSFVISRFMLVKRDSGMKHMHSAIISNRTTNEDAYNCVEQQTLLETKSSLKHGKNPS